MSAFTPPLTAVEVDAAFPLLQVSHQIGTPGGQGVVFYATHGAGAACALKIYLPGQTVERVEREIHALRQLRCVHIVTLIDEGWCQIRGENLRWTLTDYVEGEDVATILANGGCLPENEVRALFRGVCTAIDEMWAVRVVHRDIKPANLLRSSSGRYVLIDLGVAKHLSRTPITGPFMIGTLGYMSPEQARARPVLTLRSDLFSLGIVAHQCITGVHPYGGQQVAIGSVDPMPPDSYVALTPALNCAIMALLARRPADRPSSGRLACAGL